MLLEELAGKQEIKVDFHNHIHNFQQKQRRGFSGLTGLFDRIMQSAVDGVYITNFGDELRFEEWTSQEQLNLARKAGYEVEHGEYYTFFRKNDKIKFLGKSQEVPSMQGHILFAGLRREKTISSHKPLDETLYGADDGELKIADHAYAKLNGQNGIMAYSKSPEEDAGKVDAFERNGNFSLPLSFANRRAIKNAGKYHKPVLCNSDGHNPKDVGRTYNIFYSSDLDYSSERAFRDSINCSVINGDFETVFHPIPVYRIFNHAYKITMNKIKEKIHTRFHEYFLKFRGMIGI